MTNANATLWIVGTPLDDEQPLRAEACVALRAAGSIVAESRARFEKLCRRSAVDLAGKDILYLDPREDAEELRRLLSQAAAAGTSVALLSDTGMPILFDTGASVLAEARRLRFVCRSVPDATSWGTACAASGFSPPFFLAGFPPRDGADSDRFFRELRATRAHVVLLERPYKYRQLLQSAATAFGAQREAFVAWEIGTPEEQLEWNSLGKLEKEAAGRKGEFVLLVRHGELK